MYEEIIAKQFYDSDSNTIYIHIFKPIKFIKVNYVVVSKG